MCDLVADRFQNGQVTVADVALNRDLSDLVSIRS